MLLQEIASIYELPLSVVQIYTGVLSLANAHIWEEPVMNKRESMIIMMNMKQPGDLTAKVAITLSQDLGNKGYYVLSDHSPSNKNVGKIVSCYKGEYKREARLSLLDIAIVKRDTDCALALIEIEETNDRPKNLVGDAMSILLGDKITFGKDPPLEVGEWTTLIVL